MRRESDTALIDRLVLGLPPSPALTRRMQTLCDQGLTHREIGEVYGLSMGAVAVRLSRARKQKAKRGAK